MRFLRRPSATIAAVVAVPLLTASVHAQLPIQPRPVPPPPAFAYSVDLVSGATEEVYIQTPLFQQTNRPLLLIYHGWSYNNLWESAYGGMPNLNPELEALLDEAASRQWYAVSLSGGPPLTSDYPPFALTYAGPQLHVRTSAVIDEMIALYGINPSRIYTLGYSMGGIDAVNYAARHVDPEGHMIAASWCWSGTLCAEDSLPGCAQVPCTPFEHIKASVVQTDLCSCPGGAPGASFVVKESLGWNLEHIWLTTTTATSDICHVECPAPAMVALSASWADPSRHDHINDYGATHDDSSDWDPEEICDFFAGKSVSLPTSATRTIAVEETRYFWFDVLLQDDAQPGVFGWSFSGQTLDIDKIDNMTAIYVDVDGGIDSPLSSSADIAVNLVPDLGYTLGTYIILNGLSGAPSISVKLNGQDATGKWAWLPNGTSMILFRQVGLASANWEVFIP